jgi:hypothetical protein
MLSSPRKQQQTTSFAAPTPPQRQFSVITQVPRKRSSSPPRRDSQPPAATTPVVSAWPPNHLAGGGQPVAVIHQHLTLLSPPAPSPPFLPDQSPHQEEMSRETRRTELISSDPAGEVARVIDSSVKHVAVTKATIRKRRRQTAATNNHSPEGSAVVVKKRRIMQEYPVSLGITRNKVCYTLYRYQTTIKKRADWLYGLLVR